MATQNHGNGRGGGFFTFSRASPSIRLTSGKPGSSLSASSNLRTAPFHSSVKISRRPAYHTGLNLPIESRLTGMPCTKVFTAFAGMRKLNPWTMLPSGPGASDTNVSTPTTKPRSSTAGPPELPHAAGASVWITALLDASSLKPETAPLVTDASTDADLLSSSWETTTPG